VARLQAYNLESWGGKTRHNFNAVISQQELEDTYYPPFVSCSNRGNASGIMFSYKSVNGICYPHFPSLSTLMLHCGVDITWQLPPQADRHEHVIDCLQHIRARKLLLSPDCRLRYTKYRGHTPHPGVPSCASKELLTDNLREKWGFNGYITSDCGAVNDVLNSPHYSRGPDGTAHAVLAAGMDNDCGGFLGTHFQKAITSGAVSNATYTTALKNMFRVQMRLGMFDPDSIQPYRQYTSEKIDTAAHRQLALEAARQSVVLLKNDTKALPLKKGVVKTIALVGPNADATTTMQRNYHGGAPYLISPLRGLGNYTAVNYVKGWSIAGSDTIGIAAATAAAAAADATVVIIGLDGSQEGEGHDRTNITVPGVQNQLVAAVAAAANGPVVLVVMSGGIVDISTAKVNPNVAAIFSVGYPGQSGGQAIAEAICGDINPSGKLTQTWYPAKYISRCSMFDVCTTYSRAASLHPQHNIQEANIGRQD